MRGPALLSALLTVGLCACAARRAARDPGLESQLQRMRELKAELDRAARLPLLPLPPALYIAEGPKPLGGEAPEQAHARWKQSVILTRLNIDNLKEYLRGLEEAPLPRRKKRAQLREYGAHLERESARLARLEAEAPPGPSIADVARRWIDRGEDVPPGSEVILLYRDGSSETLSMDAVLALGR